MIGYHLSHYLISAELGRGGMGVVYQAEDTKLDRTVALKVLPTHSLASVSDRDRFYREARASARLNHPSIATVFEVDERVPEDASGEPVGDEARPFIALEYIEGITLADRVASGPLPIEEAVRIAQQVTEALGAAHELGIVHRDIKSGNIMLTAKGQVKVLDFGLAKTAESTLLTQQGSTLGTVAYMSPEQAGGEEVDGRTDLWALGVVLYEMIAGHLPFVADYEQARLYSILNEDPQPLTALRTGVPMELEALVSKCLRKDRETRYQSAEGLAADLRALEDDTPAIVTKATSTDLSIWPSSSSRPTWPIALGLTMAALAIGLLFGRTLPQSRPGSFTEVYSLSLPLRDDQRPIAVEVHPDNRHVLVATGDSTDTSPQLVVVDLRTREQRILAGTRGVVAMDLSPDGSWVVFGTENQLHYVPFVGGEAVQLIEAQNVSTVSWGPGDTVLFTAWDGAYVLKNGESKASRLANEFYAQGVGGYFNPRWIPGTSMVLVDRNQGANVNNADSTELVLFDFDSEEVTSLVRGACCGRYVESGHLLYASGGTFQAGNGQLIARPMNLRKRTVHGRPTAIPGGGSTGQLDISPDGLFVRLGGDRTEVGMRTLVEVDLATGEERLLPLPDNYYSWVRWSPGGSSLLAEVSPLRGSATAVIMTPLTGTVQRLSTTLSEVFSPSWSPDGSQISVVAPGANVGVNGDLYVVPASGASSVTELYLSQQTSFNFTDWSPSGEWIAARGRDQELLSEQLWRIDVPSGNARQLRDDIGLDRYPRISRTSEFIAYDKQLDGQISVWVMTNDGRDRWMVDADGSRPVWHPDGGSIVFKRGNALFETRVSTENGFGVIGSPSERVRLDYDFLFDIHPSGDRLVLAALLPDDTSTPADLEIVTNWFDELDRLSPEE